MHTNHFGLDEKSFSPRDPRGFYRNADFDTACATLLRGIRTRRGLLLLTSEAGLGKTSLLHRCMAEADDIRFILLGNPRLDFSDILNYLCADMELRGDESNIERQSRQLRDALATRASRGQAVALLIDDAHHLRVGALLRLWEFVEGSAVEAGQRLQVVLAGLPEIEGKLRQPELRPLQKSLQVHCRLERLSPMETGLFVAHQFRAAGHPDDRLSSAMIERIAHHGQGVPRTIALLCDTVLLLTSLQSEREITPTLVDEAARNCFLSDSAPATPATPGGGGEFDLAGTELDFDFDFALDETPAAEQTVALAPKPAKTTPIQAHASQAASMTANAGSASAPAPAKSPPSPAPAITLAKSTPTPPPAKPASASALLPPLRAFLQLLDEIAAKQDHKNARDREVFRRFRHRYQWLARNAPAAWLTHYEQRMTRLAESQQPMLVALTITPHAGPEPGGTLGALLINPSWWLYREIRVRLRGADLEFTNGGQMLSLRLLDGRDAQPVYLDYRLTRVEPGPATLQLELDLLDHRGTWHAYRGPDEIRLAPPRRSETTWGTGQEVSLTPGHEQFWLDTPEPRTDTVALVGATGDSSFTLPLKLTVDDERTHRLRASVTATHQALGRGTTLSRALLLVADPTQAPARIELVSRPFIILGRYNPNTGAGFGDFALGFVPEYTRISRLHAVICALGDQLALMPASDQDRTYTGQNGQRLARGQWRLLEANDNLDICDLYRLKLTLVWDRHGERDLALDWDPQEPRDKFGHYLLDLVDALHQRDRQSGNEDARAILRNRYANLVSIQDRVAEINGVGNPGTLLHARFERDDEASRQVVHYYVPKWLSLGSSPQAGLPIAAAGVAPLHAELLFREGMYWIQNLAGPGSVQVGCHGLATNEVLALETGDVLTIGAARFEFEAY